MLLTTLEFPEGWILLISSIIHSYKCCKLINPFTSITLSLSYKLHYLNLYLNLRKWKIKTIITNFLACLHVLPMSIWVFPGFLVHTNQPLDTKQVREGNRWTHKQNCKNPVVFSLNGQVTHIPIGLQCHFIIDTKWSLKKLNREAEIVCLVNNGARVNTSDCR